MKDAVPFESPCEKEEIAVEQIASEYREDQVLFQEQMNERM